MTAGTPRLKNAALFAAPLVFLFWLYREGLTIWFLQDDFAWLSLLPQVHSWRDVVRILFEPAAQGTIRPWSERGYFLLLHWLFGIDNLPFRIVAFATTIGDLLLIGWIVRRLTASPLAGAVAGIVWLANSSLVTAMTWSSAWNELLCPLFLLAALASFIRFTETESQSWWWLQLAIFVLGFGALEINIVYPALALAWCLFAASPERRGQFARSTVPLWLISAAYFLLHRAVAPIPKTGPYALHIDASILTTLAIYLKWSFLPTAWTAAKHSRTLGSLILLTAGTSILALSYFEWRRRRTVALFFAAWFVITLAPLLPLSEHRTDYYLTIPCIAVGMLAGWSLESAWRDTSGSGLRTWQIWPGIVIALYLFGMISVTRLAMSWSGVQAEQARNLVYSVEVAHRTHPDQTIVLEGITTDLFNNAVGHSAFRVVGVPAVYLTPGSELKIHPVPGLADLSDLVLEPAVIEKSLTTNQIVLYSLSGDHLRNITEVYRRSAPDRFTDRLPSKIDLGNPLYSWLAGPEWLPLEAGFRWMPQRATVRLGFPEISGIKVALTGYCPEVLLQHGSRTITVSADGIVLGTTNINHPEANFYRLFPIPASLAGKKSVELEIQVTPAERIDGRELGLIFGKVAVVN